MQGKCSIVFIYRNTVYDWNVKQAKSHELSYRLHINPFSYSLISWHETIMFCIVKEFIKNVKLVTDSNSFTIQRAMEKSHQ